TGPEEIGEAIAIGVIAGGEERGIDAVRRGQLRGKANFRLEQASTLLVGVDGNRPRRAVALGELGNCPVDGRDTETATGGRVSPDRRCILALTGQLTVEAYVLDVPCRTSVYIADNDLIVRVVQTPNDVGRQRQELRKLERLVRQDVVIR